jgi:hypothetical protein
MATNSKPSSKRCWVLPDEPDDLADAVTHAEAAFGGQLGRLDYEAYLDPDSHGSDVIQLRKACRLLDACRLLRDHDGYHTSVIEMSFAAIERTLECYALTRRTTRSTTFGKATTGPTTALRTSSSSPRGLPGD